MKFRRQHNEYSFYTVPRVFFKFQIRQVQGSIVFVLRNLKYYFLTHFGLSVNVNSFEGFLVD